MLTMDSNVDHSDKNYIIHVTMGITLYGVYSFTTVHEPPLGDSNSLYNNVEMHSVLTKYLL